MKIVSNKPTAKQIVAREVKQQAMFGMEPSWEDFVSAGIESTKAQKPQDNKMEQIKELLVDYYNCPKERELLDSFADKILALFSIVDGDSVEPLGFRIRVVEITKELVRLQVFEKCGDCEVIDHGTKNLCEGDDIIFFGKSVLEGRE